jgi:hypothetical protein
MNELVKRSEIMLAEFERQEEEQCSRVGLVVSVEKDMIQRLAKIEDHLTRTVINGGMPIPQNRALDWQTESIDGDEDEHDKTGKVYLDGRFCLE